MTDQSKPTTDRKDLLLFLCMGFSHKMENGEHVISAYGKEYRHTDLLCIGSRVQRDFLVPAAPTGDKVSASPGSVLNCFEAIVTQARIEPDDHLGNYWAKKVRISLQANTAPDDLVKALELIQTVYKDHPEVAASTISNEALAAHKAKTQETR